MAAWLPATCLEAKVPYYLSRGPHATPALSGLCLADYSAPPFIGRWGFSLGIPFVRYDITPLPANTLPPLSEPANHGDSRQAVVLRMRYKFGPNTASFHFFSSFRRENIYTRLSNLLLSVSYAFVHAFQVSKQGRVMSFSVLSSPHHCTRMLILISLFQFYGRWQTGRSKRPLRP